VYAVVDATKKTCEQELNGIDLGHLTAAARQQKWKEQLQHIVKFDPYTPTNTSGPCSEDVDEVRVVPVSQILKGVLVDQLLLAFRC
jgi:hypothetical protein